MPPVKVPKSLVNVNLCHSFLAQSSARFLELTNDDTSLSIFVQLSPADNFDDGGLDDEDLTRLDTQSQSHAPAETTALQVEDSAVTPPPIDLVDGQPDNQPEEYPVDRPSEDPVLTVTNNNRRRIQRKRKPSLPEHQPDALPEPPRRSKRSRQTSPPQVVTSSSDDEADDEGTPPPRPPDAQLLPSQPPLTQIDPPATQNTESCASDSDHLVHDEASQWLADQINTSSDKPLRSTRPHLQRKLLKTAMSIGHASIIEQWQDVYRHWRANGSLSSFVNAEPLSHSAWDLQQNVVSLQPHLQHLKAEIKAFYLAWNIVNQLNVNKTLNDFCHRQRRADLYDSYQLAEQRLRLTANPSGERVDAAAKQTLFRILYPQWKDIENPSRAEATRAAYAKYDRLIKAGKRWSHLRIELGTGIFALMPEFTISHRFIENDLRAEQFNVWVDLVQRFNPRAVELGRLILAGLEQALSGSRPSRKRLLLETIQQSKIKTIPDMRDLFEEVDEGLATSGDEGDVFQQALIASAHDQQL